MTREEAIAVLDKEATIIDDNSIEMTAREWDEFDDLKRDAIPVAIEALRKQIPKNPVINFVSDSDGSRRLEESWVEDALLCPVCHTYFGEVYEQGYCVHCGQKLIQKRVRVIKP